MKRLIKEALSLAGYRVERIRPHRGSPPPEKKPLPSIEGALDIEFHVGEWRYEAPVDHLVCRPCFGYGPNSWHPFVAAVRELVDNPSLRYEDSVLSLHYARWRPESIAEAHLPNEGSSDPVLSRIRPETLFEPWILRPPPCDDPLNSDCKPSGSPMFGPISVERGQRQFLRLRKMLRSIQSFGYRPDGFPRGLVRVIVLRHGGEQQYLVSHGQHRAAVLAALGHETIEVGIHRSLPAVINSDGVQSWPHVASRLVSEESAARLLARYFPRTLDEDPALAVATRIIDSGSTGDVQL